jgi:hypothetical protein
VTITANHLYVQETKCRSCHLCSVQRTSLIIWWNNKKRACIVGQTLEVTILRSPVVKFRSSQPWEVGQKKTGTLFIVPLLHFYSGGVPNLTSLSREIFPMFGKWGEEGEDEKMEGKWKEVSGARQDGVGKRLEHHGTQDTIVPGDQRWWY